MTYNSCIGYSGTVITDDGLLDDTTIPNNTDLYSNNIPKIIYLFLLSLCISCKKYKI